MPADHFKLVLEITERAMIDKNRSLENFDWLHEQGFEIAIDDFGTGHSALIYLERFSFDYLKIDRGFVQAIGTETVTSPVLDAVITLPPPEARYRCRRRGNAGTGGMAARSWRKLFAGLLVKSPADAGSADRRPRAAGEIFPNPLSVLYYLLSEVRPLQACHWRTIPWLCLPASA